MNVTTAYNKYLKHLVAIGRKPKTLSTYKQRLSPFVSAYGDTLLESIDEEIIDDFMIVLYERRVQFKNHPKRRPVHKPLSKETIKAYGRVLKSFFSFCVARGYRRSHPASHLQTTVKQSKRIKDMSPADMNALIGICQKDTRLSGRRDTALLMFLRDTGARSGEVCSIMRRDIDLDKRMAWSYGKTGEGQLFFTEETAKALKAWLQEAPPSEWLFCGLHITKGEAMTTNSIYSAMRRRARDLDVKQFNPHSIRHAVGTAWGDQHGLLLTQRKLRHVDPKSTLIYIRTDEEKMRRLTDETDIS